MYLKKSEIRPEEISTVFISHNHSDHINGLDDFVTLHSVAKIYMSNEITRNTFGNGITIFERSYNAVKNRIVFREDTEKQHEILPKIYSTGFPSGYLGKKRITATKQSLVLNTQIGLVKIIGWGHPDIIHIAKRAKEIANKPVYMLLGGFHLGGKRMSEDKINSIINQLKDPGVQKCGPTHCSGEMAIRLFKQNFMDNFIEMGVIKKVVF